FSSRRRHTRWPRDWSSDVCSSDLARSSAAATGVGDADERSVGEHEYRLSIALVAWARLDVVAHRAHRRLDVRAHAVALVLKHVREVLMVHSGRVGSVDDVDVEVNDVGDHLGSGGDE